MTKGENKLLWLTWETQRRNAELAEAFSAKYLALDYSSKPSAIRYCISAARTVVELVGFRPRVLFVQYPSLVLCFLAYILKPIFGYKLIIDAHNAAVEAAASPSMVGKLTRLIMRGSDLVIISNLGLQEKLANFNLAILPDKIPNIESPSFPNHLGERPKKLITLIASFSSDEPIEEVLKAHCSLDLEEPVSLYVTGKRSKAGPLLSYENSYVKFVDYLKASDYDGLIANSDLLIDLTTRDDCLVCGAYEALAVQVPVILSETEALKETFGSAAIYSKNSASELSAAIRLYLSDPQGIREKIASGKQQFQESWNNKFETVLKKISQISEANLF